LPAAAAAISVFCELHAPGARLSDARGSDETLHERLLVRAWLALHRLALPGPELFALLTIVFHGVETFRSPEDNAQKDEECLQPVVRLFISATAGSRSVPLLNLGDVCEVCAVFAFSPLDWSHKILRTIESNC
jgi:hypothetical protein